MTPKPATWPSALTENEPRRWNVRQLDGSLAFSPDLTNIETAKQARDAINRAFDWGREKAA